MIIIQTINHLFSFILFEKLLSYKPVVSLPNSLLLAYSLKKAPPLDRSPLK